MRDLKQQKDGQGRSLALQGGTLKKLAAHEKTTPQPSLYIEWLKRYRAFLLFLLIFMIGTTLICWYFVEVFQSERAYQVKEVRENKI
jgi:hypothetical protein